MLLGHREERLVRSDSKEPRRKSRGNPPASFRGGAKHRTRNLEIPGLVQTHLPGMTELNSSIPSRSLSWGTHSRDPMARNDGLDPLSSRPSLNLPSFPCIPSLKLPHKE